MKTFIRTFGVLALALAAGCLQAKQTTTVMPDGSGKVLMTIGLKKSMVKMMQEMAKQFGGDAPADPFADYTDPDKLQANSEGVAAWSVGKVVEEGEWMTATVTGWFDDINKAKIYTEQTDPTGAKTRKLSFAFKHEKSDAGGALVMQAETTGELKDVTQPGGQDPGADVAKAMLEMLKPMLHDMKIAFTMTVPGPIKEAPGFMEKKDRTATISIDGKAMIEAISDPNSEQAKRLKSIGESKANRIAWTENTVSDDEAKTFKKDLSEAKESWAKVLEEHKKKKAAK